VVSHLVWCPSTPVGGSLDPSLPPGAGLEEVAMTTMANGTQRTVTRGFAALMLLTAGGLVLAGRAVPVAGDMLALVLGIELLVWAQVTGEDGLLVTGGVLTGVGVGILVAAWPLRGAEPHTTGGAFLLSVAAGFLLVGVLSALRRQQQLWAWICAAAVAVVGGGLVAGPDSLAGLLAWGVPAVLLAAGATLGLRWLHSSRP
jgi:hypothetical protein